MLTFSSPPTSGLVSRVTDALDALPLPALDQAFCREQVGAQLNHNKSATETDTFAKRALTEPVEQAVDAEAASPSVATPGAGTPAPRATPSHTPKNVSPLPSAAASACSPINLTDLLATLGASPEPATGENDDLIASFDEQALEDAIGGGSPQSACLRMRVAGSPTGQPLAPRLSPSALAQLDGRAMVFCALGVQPADLSAPHQLAAEVFSELFAASSAEGAEGAEGGARGERAGGACIDTHEGAAADEDEDAWLNELEVELCVDGAEEGDGDEHDDRDYYYDDEEAWQETSSAAVTPRANDSRYNPCQHCDKIIGGGAGNLLKHETRCAREALNGKKAAAPRTPRLQRPATRTAKAAMPSARTPVVTPSAKPSAPSLSAPLSGRLAKSPAPRPAPPSSAKSTDAPSSAAAVKRGASKTTPLTEAVDTGRPTPLRNLPRGGKIPMADRLASHAPPGAGEARPCAVRKRIVRFDVPEGGEAGGGDASGGDAPPDTSKAQRVTRHSDAHPPLAFLPAMPMTGGALPPLLGAEIGVLANGMALGGTLRGKELRMLIGGAVSHGEMRARRKEADAGATDLDHPTLDDTDEIANLLGFSSWTLSPQQDAGGPSTNVASPTLLPRLSPVSLSPLARLGLRGSRGTSRSRSSQSGTGQGSTSQSGTSQSGTRQGVTSQSELALAGMSPRLLESPTTWATNLALQALPRGWSCFTPTLPPATPDATQPPFAHAAEAPMWNIAFIRGARRPFSSSKWEFLIRWEGRPASSDTWEFRDDLFDIESFPELQRQMDQFMKVAKTMSDTTWIQDALPEGGRAARRESAAASSARLSAAPKAAATPPVAPKPPRKRTAGREHDAARAQATPVTPISSSLANAMYAPTPEMPAVDSGEGVARSSSQPQGANAHGGGAPAATTKTNKRARQLEEPAGAKKQSKSAAARAEPPRQLEEPADPDGSEATEAARVKMYHPTSGRTIGGKSAPMRANARAWLDSHPGWKLAPGESLHDDDEEEEEAPVPEPRVKMYDPTSGRTIGGKSAPKRANARAWLDSHPGWKLAPGESLDDDDEEVEEDEDDDDDNDDEEEDVGGAHAQGGGWQHLSRGEQEDVRIFSLGWRMCTVPSKTVAKATKAAGRELILARDPTVFKNTASPLLKKSKIKDRLVLAKKAVLRLVVSKASCKEGRDAYTPERFRAGKLNEDELAAFAKMLLAKKA